MQRNECYFLPPPPNTPSTLLYLPPLPTPPLSTLLCLWSVLTQQCAHGNSWWLHEGQSILRCPQHPHWLLGLQGPSPCQSCHQYRPVVVGGKRGVVEDRVKWNSNVIQYAPHGLFHNSSAKCLPGVNMR